jgi:cytochrome c556
MPHKELCDSVLTYVSRENDITKEQVKEIWEKSEKFMEILMKKYGTDINTMSAKMKEYQKNLIKNMKK